MSAAWDPSCCNRCAKPTATDEDFRAIEDGQGEHLCWGAWGNCHPDLSDDDLILSLRLEVARLRAEGDGSLRTPEIGDRVMYRGLAGDYEGTVEDVCSRPPFLCLRWTVGGGSMQAEVHEVKVLPPVEGEGS